MSNLNNFKTIERTSITDSIVEQIKEMVIESKILPGDKLPSERELATRLLVSRPTVREAMKSLQYMGIVEIRSGSGTYLNSENDVVLDYFQKKQIFKKFELSEMIEIRKVIEVDAAGLAAERRTAKDIVKLKELYEATIDEKLDATAHINADFSFHIALAEATQNRFLYQMLNLIRDLLVDLNYELIQIEKQVVQAHKSHEAILAAVINQDVVRAKKEMLHHLKTIEDTANRLYQNGETSPVPLRKN
jgi:Transcriptional regulators